MRTAEVLHGQNPDPGDAGKAVGRAEMLSQIDKTRPDRRPSGLALGARLSAGFSSAPALAPVAVLVLPTARNAGESSR